MTLSSSIELELSPTDAFDQFIAELKESLKARGIEFDPKGKITEGSVKVGTIIEWERPTRVEIEWRTATALNPDDLPHLKFEFEPLKNGRTKINLEIQDWGDVVGDQGEQLLEWFTDEIAANFLKATSPEQFTEWLTDKRARKPTGARARSTYRDPIYHRPNFLAILDYLKLKQDDYLLEVGCGGGAFLFDALKGGCRASAIDHSPDMVKLAKEVNSSSVAEGRLEIKESEADSLPFSDNMFTCAVSTGVFGFIERPSVVLSEMHRVLKSGGRLVLFTGSKELKGTPAAPEPIASQLHFYEDEELVELARAAGFHEARVERPSLERFARESGIPKEAMPLFSGPGGGGQFLLARKA